MSNFVQPKQQHPGAGISAILKNVFFVEEIIFGCEYHSALRLTCCLSLKTVSSSRVRGDERGDLWGASPSSFV